MRMYSNVEYVESNFPEFLFYYPDSIFASFLENISCISLYPFPLTLFEFSSSEAPMTFIMDCMWCDMGHGTWLTCPCQNILQCWICWILLSETLAVFQIQFLLYFRKMFLLFFKVHFSVGPFWVFIQKYQLPWYWIVFDCLLCVLASF